MNDNPLIDVEPQKELIERVAEIINGRSLLSLREQLLVDCVDEIVRLRKLHCDVVDKAVAIVERTNLKDKKSTAIKAIKELKSIS